MKTDATQRSDALVMFGATGDLARKKLFPAVYQMEARDVLDGIRVIGVASSDWDDARLREHARGSLEDKGLEVDEQRWGRLSERIAYIRGDYTAAATYEALAERLADRELVWQVAQGAELDRFVGDAPVLTDDFSPVDQLLTPYGS